MLSRQQQEEDGDIHVDTLNGLAQALQKVGRLSYKLCENEEVLLIVLIISGD